MAMTIGRRSLMLMLASPALLAALGSGLANPQRIRKSKAVGRRDLQLYDQVGPFDFGLGLDSGGYYARDSPEFLQILSAMAQAREFLWMHWRGQTRGYVRAMYHTVDAGDWTTHFFVEPDKAGRWGVVSRQEYDGKLSDTQTWYRIHRVTLTVDKAGFFRTGPSLADDAQLDSGQYALIFDNAGGTASGPL